MPRDIFSDREDIPFEVIPDETCFVHLLQKMHKDNPSHPIHKLGGCSCNDEPKKPKKDKSNPAPVSSLADYLQPKEDNKQDEDEDEESRNYLIGETNPAKFLPRLSSRDIKGTHKVTETAIHISSCRKHAVPIQRILSYGLETSSAIKELNSNADASTIIHVRGIKEKYRQRAERLSQALKNRKNKAPMSDIAGLTRTKGSEIFSLDNLTSETPTMDQILGDDGIEWM